MARVRRFLELGSSNVRRQGLASLHRGTDRAHAHSSSFGRLTVARARQLGVAYGPARSQSV